MECIFTGKNIEITQALKDHAISKLNKLEKFFHEEIEVHVTMLVEKSHQVVDVTVFAKGVVLRAKEKNLDMYVSIDTVIEKLEGQIRKNKTKINKKLRKNIINVDTFKNVEEEPEEEYQIIKSNNYDLKPMSIEEAILQMNLLNHEFLAFINSKTGKMNVIYKRKNGVYGLIES